MAGHVFSYKPDWEKAQAHWEAFWDLVPLDRPCLLVTAPRTDGEEITLPPIADEEDRWMNPEYVLAGTLRYLETHYLGGGDTARGALLHGGHHHGLRRAPGVP